MEFEKLKREYAELLKDNTEYAKENMRLTIFYSELMNFLYQNTSLPEPFFDYLKENVFVG